MYGSDATRKQLVTQHSYRKPGPGAQKTLKELRQRFLDLAVYIDSAMPASREKSLAQTKLDEARMWASNAATLGGEIVEDLTVNVPPANHVHAD